MIVLVCGSRDWTDRDAIETVLDGYFCRYPTLTVIEGGARGADRIAGQWAARMRENGVGWVRFPADWQRHGRGAGHIRNKEMLGYLLKAGEGIVHAFKDDFEFGLGQGGTENMVQQARQAGVRVFLTCHP